MSVRDKIIAVLAAANVTIEAADEAVTESRLNNGEASVFGDEFASKLHKIADDLEDLLEGESPMPMKGAKS